MDFQNISNWFRNRDFFDGEYIDARIPAALSNDDNRLLEENVEAKVKELASKQLDIDENIDRIQLLEDHHKIVQDEIQTIQRLLTARRMEETTEQLHFDIDLAEIQRLERMNTNLDYQLMKFTKRKTSFESEINHLNAEIMRINKETMNEKEALEKLIEMMKEHDEEAFCFIKYTQEDNTRIRELTNELERLSEKSIKLKRATEEERLEYSSLEVELDKIAEGFRRSHYQRQQLIKQWETILTQMQRKDNDIDKLAHELIQIKIKFRSNEQAFNEQKVFYEREQKNNEITEKLIDLAKQNLKKLKIKQKTSIEKHQYLETNILSVRTVLFNTDHQLQRERAAFNELKMNISSKAQQLAKFKQHHEQILDRKRFILNENITIQDKLSKLEKSMENEQKYQNNLNSQYKKLSETFFLLNNEVSSICKREKQVDIDNQIHRNQLHNSKNQIQKLDQQLFKQQELIYHQDFLKQTVDRRLNRLLGEKSNEKTSESELKIRQLQNEFQKKKAQHIQLANQMKILQEELRIIKRDFNQLNEEKNDSNEKFLQFDLYINLSEKMIQKLNTEKEDYLVEVNLLHVELKRLKNNLHDSSGTNSNLEQQRIEIQKAIKERRMEVQANTHLFRMRYNDERTKKAVLSTEFAMRVTKITKLKQRYESFAVMGNAEKSNDDNIFIQAQHVIKSAQMKEDLLKQGDQLEALVIKAETELRALENTVQILNWKNSDVKKTFEKLKESSEEICEMKELEEHLRAATEQVKIRRKRLKDLIDKNKAINPTELSNEIERNNIVNEGKRQILIKLENEIEQYRIKTVRADQLIKRYEQTIKEEDIDIRVQHETNKKLEQQLISLCLTIGDDNLINTFEQLSETYGDKIIVKQSVTQFKSGKKSSMSSLPIVPNIVNISINRSF
ncbi:hypothetical protein I4U23_024330 [Adineta vaga]|nr:hypothetical protein I4U23_024330 [Adineta vaga]